MIIVMILFFSSCAFASQRYADRPENPNSNNNTLPSTAPSYYHNPIFPRTIQEKLNAINARETGPELIFGGDDDDNHNNPYKRMKLSREREVFVVAQIILIGTTNMITFRDILLARYQTTSFFSYTGNVFQWRKNNNHKPGLSFETLETAIIYAQDHEYDNGDFAMLDLNLRVVPDEANSATQIPNTPINQVAPEKLFTLFVITPNINAYLVYALVVAFENSRLRDPYESLYAILSHFDINTAHRLSKEDNQINMKFLHKLYAHVIQYCTPEHMPVINQILKGQGDADYLSKLQNLEELPNIGPIPGLKPSFYFPFVGALKFILQLNGLWSTSKLLKQIWVTKKIPSIPTGFFQKARSFAILLGTGLLLKNLFNVVQPFVTKQKDRK